MIDRRFATALQIMQNLVLAERNGMTFVSSSQFAEGLRANPTLVRRLLSTLAQQGLLVSQLGRKGGVRLARPAEQISLAEIYRASIAGKKLWEGRTDLPHLCVVSANFEDYFDALVRTADAAVAALLEAQTLASSFAKLEEIDSAKQHRCEAVIPSAKHRQA